MTHCAGNEKHITDLIDEFVAQQPKEFDCKILKSTTKECFEIDVRDEKTDSCLVYQPKAAIGCNDGLTHCSHLASRECFESEITQEIPLTEELSESDSESSASASCMVSTSYPVIEKFCQQLDFALEKYGGIFQAFFLDGRHQHRQ